MTRPSGLLEIQCTSSHRCSAWDAASLKCLNQLACGKCRHQLRQSGIFQLRHVSMSNIDPCNSVQIRMCGLDLLLTKLHAVFYQNACKPFGSQGCSSVFSTAENVYHRRPSGSAINRSKLWAPIVNNFLSCVGTISTCLGPVVSATCAIQMN